MNILIEDGFSSGVGTGVGKYSDRLFRSLQHLGANTIEFPEKPFLSSIPSAAFRRLLYILWLNTGLQRRLRCKGTDIAHFTNYLIPKIRLSQAQYAVTIHDLTAYLHPETLPTLNLIYDRWAIKLALRNADLIVTVSESVRSELKSLFPSENVRVETIHNNLPAKYIELPKQQRTQLPQVLRMYGITGDYLLCVGTIEERKNLLTLLEAFRKLRSDRDLHLILAGKPGYGYRRVIRYISDHQLGGSVMLPGYVSEEEKLALYDHASLFVFPSRYEGFGLPILEAMARELPVVAGRIPSTEEVAGGSVYYYGDPENHRALEQGIRRVLDDRELRQRFIVKGAERARQFADNNSGQEYLRAYRSISGVDE